MNAMMSGMDKNIAEGKYDPMGILEHQMDDDRPVGPSCSPAKYVEPSSEPRSREA